MILKYNFFFSLGISLKQIYRTTSDNARNMKKATELTRNELQSLIDCETEYEEENDEFDYPNVDNAAALLVTTTKCRKIAIALRKPTQFT